MPQTSKQIKKAIKAIGTIKKTTKTMQLISLSKMQKNARIWARSKKYLEQILTIARTVGGSKKTTNPISAEGAVPLIVLFASDRGLCGSFNTKVITATKAQYAQLGPNTLVLAVGKRAGAIKNTVGGALVSLYPSAHNNLTTEAVAPVSSQVSALIASGKVSEVVVVYTAYQSAFSQQVTSQKIFPLDLIAIPVDPTLDNESTLYCIEPDPDTIMSYLTPVYLEAMLFRCWIESAVSEHTARMQAMKNATDAAKDIIDTLTLELNKTRQAAITQEIAQIMGARKSMTTL